MRTIHTRVNTPLILLLACITLRAQDHGAGSILPDASGPWHAIAATAVYDTKSIFEYLDGGAEIYLAYGMTTAYARRYESPGKPAIEASVFTMREPAGAFGIFTYERMDDEAGIGQGSEYGGGILRFWQGRTFVFLQAETETPEVHDAVLALGREIATHLGSPSPLPALATVLPPDDQRALALRYTLTPTVIQNLEPALAGNPLDLPPSTPAVLGRYGRPQDNARILVMALPDTATAQRCARMFRERFITGPATAGSALRFDAGRSIADAAGRHLILLLEMPDTGTARRHLQQIITSLRRIER
jgi:hypothetical protein